VTQVLDEFNVPINVGSKGVLNTARFAPLNQADCGVAAQSQKEEKGPPEKASGRPRHALRSPPCKRHGSGTIMRYTSQGVFGGNRRWDY
jgi:hypothetical protein